MARSRGQKKGTQKKGEVRARPFATQKHGLLGPRMDVRPAPGLERQATSAGAPITVLLVDDEPLLLRTTQKMLEQRGFSVICADSADAAMEVVTSARALDLLMTDITLRRTDGRDLAGRARAVRPDLRVLYVSGFDAETFGFEGPNACDGCTEAFLAKPYTAGELEDRLRDLFLPEGSFLPLEMAPTTGVTSRDRVR